MLDKNEDCDYPWYEGEGERFGSIEEAGWGEGHAIFSKLPPPMRIGH